MPPVTLTTPFAAASSANLTAWRIAFVVGDRDDSSATIAIDDTGDVFARCERADADQLLAGSTAPSDLALATLSLSAPPEVLSRVEAWVRARGPVIEARLKAARVLIGRSRAMVVAPDEQLVDSMDAIVRYCVIADGVEALEKQVAAALSGLEIKAPALPVMSQAEAASAKRSLLRWQRAIEQFRPDISQHSQRLFGELDEAGRLEERIEMLEDPVQTLYDFSALASERKHYNVGIVIEVAILVVLLCELAVMAFQLMVGGKG